MHLGSGVGAPSQQARMQRSFFSGYRKTNAITLFILVHNMNVCEANHEDRYGITFTCAASVGSMAWSCKSLSAVKLSCLDVVICPIIAIRVFDLGVSFGEVRRVYHPIMSLQMIANLVMSSQTRNWPFSSQTRSLTSLCSSISTRALLIGCN